MGAYALGVAYCLGASLLTAPTPAYLTATLILTLIPLIMVIKNQATGRPPEPLNTDGRKAAWGLLVFAAAASFFIWQGL